MIRLLVDARIALLAFGRAAGAASAQVSQHQ
jgi:hypothetical protein